MRDEIIGRQHGYLFVEVPNTGPLPPSTVRGKRVVSFTAGKHTVTGTLSDRNLVEQGA